MVNSVKLKIFSVWSKIQPKTTEIIFSPYFPKNLFLLSLTRTASLKASLLRPIHRAKRNDPHQRTTIAILPVTGTAPIDVDHDHDRDRADRRQSRSSESARLRDRDLGAIYDLFWVLFEFLGMNDIMCLFGSWENVSNK